MAEELKLAGSRYNIRPATKDDVKSMTEVFFNSFNQPFWQYFISDSPGNRQWWDEAWEMGIDNPTDQSFVVEDTKNGNRVVAFSRWMVPQQDGNLERKWPEMKEDEWDMEVVENFFGGMEQNRHELMGSRPHWSMFMFPSPLCLVANTYVIVLEMLGTHENYQKQGIVETSD